MNKETLVHELGHAICLSISGLKDNGKQDSFLIIQNGVCNSIGKTDDRHGISSCYSAVGAAIAYKLVSSSFDGAREALIAMSLSSIMSFIQYEAAASIKSPGSDAVLMAQAAPTTIDGYWASKGWQLGCQLALNNQFEIWCSTLPTQIVFLPVHAKLLLTGALPSFVSTKNKTPILELI